MNSYDVIIAGAGASGLMCALEAAKRGRSVLIIEHAEKAGKKILISGGGRCNFTNLSVQPDNYVSSNPHFCKSALSRYSQNDFLELVKKHGIEYYEKTLGQLFCVHRSSEILNMLLKECRDTGVRIIYNTSIKNIARLEKFLITADGEKYSSESFVVATGGLSIPKMGATSFGYDAARQFGLNIIPCKPALTGLILKGQGKFKELAGVSAEANVKCDSRSFRENILFTHKGVSGPAILQISNYWNKGEKIEIDFLPADNAGRLIEEWKLSNPKAEVKNLIGRIIPKKLVLHLIPQSIADKNILSLNSKDIKYIQQAIHEYRIEPEAPEGYDKAEVTRGGVDTNELSSKTFESKKVEGLYFIGEVIDVTGWLGGYNFQWAWSSGYCAGQYV